MTETDAAVWKALSDPVRRTILDALRDGPLTTGTLCEKFDQTRFGVMKHLSVLEEAGLISVERRGRERWNYLNAVALKTALDRWLTPFQQLWSVSLSLLADKIGEESKMPGQALNRVLDIRQEAIFPASRNLVFKALTEGVNDWWCMRQTGPESILCLVPEIGASMIEESLDGRHKAIWARVEEVRVPDLLYLSGRFAVEGAVAGRVHFDLQDLGDKGCRLTVSHQAIGPFAGDAQPMFSEGWRDLIENHLRAYLGKAG